jgi:hypothetical protein
MRLARNPFSGRMNSTDAKGQAARPDQVRGNNHPNRSACPCGVCGNPGAEWLLVVKGEVPKRVHRKCGVVVAQAAPEGITAKVKPSKALRDRWQEQKLVQNFWTQKLNAAATAKKPTSPSGDSG